MSCGMCSHKFPLNATTGDHECNQPTFHVEVLELKPMEAPSSNIFYMDCKYGFESDDLQDAPSPQTTEENDK